MGNTTGKYTDSITLAGGTGLTTTIQIIGTMRTANVNSQISAGTLIVSSLDGRQWSCTGGNLGIKFRPAACR
jgi:hypothetical protein